MERTKTERYECGMRAINNFYAMLYKAMKEAMPTAQLSNNGAYGWRGYQINKYENLAHNQYYCQVYQGDPFEFSDKYGRIGAFTCRELVFKESYIDNAHMPVDDHEEKLCIKTGRYYYPFRTSLDLYRSRFFLMDVDEQYKHLRNFVTYAAKQALIWQDSQARVKVTNPKFLKGAKVPTPKSKRFNQFQKVEIDFLDAWGMQHRLFTKLITQMYPYKPQQAKTEKDWIRQNASIHHFNYRGYHMKSGKISPGDFDMRWLIYFDEPNILGCYTSELSLVKKFNLVKNNYFDLSEDQQDEELKGFVNKCFDSV